MRDRLSGVQSMAVVEPLGVGREVARQFGQGCVPRQFGKLRQGRADVIAEPVPAVGQQPAAALLEKGGCGGRLVAEEVFAGVGEGVGGVVNIEDLGAVAELPPCGVPDSRGAVAEDGDCGSIGDPEAVGPSAPMGGEVVDRLDRRERHPGRRRRQVAVVPFRGGRRCAPFAVR